MFDKVTEINLLYDFYSQLLTEKQREVVRLYHCENYSLAEIADNLSISRQGVHDTLKISEKALAEYEEKLGMVRRFEYASGLLKEAEKHIGALKKIMEELGN